VTAASTTSKVQFCSVVSAASGEDPIGSAWHAASYLMIELPLPWKYNTLESPNTPPGLHELVQGLYARGIYPPMIGFAPDPDHSVPGMTRIIDYRVPPAPFAGYDQREYLVPTSRVAGLLANRLEDRPGPELEAFAVVAGPPQRDLYVCTHGAIDACCATFGYPLYKLLRHMAANPDHNLRVWRCTHFGGHRFAATLLDMPTGRYWGHLEARDLGPLVRRDGDMAGLRHRYRGWAALPYGAAQVAEGELFLRAGWEWLGCAVAPSPTPPFDWENPVLPEQSVTFTVSHPGQGIDGTAEVLVSPNGFIQTMGTSNGDFTDAQQFTTRITATTGNASALFDGEAY